MKREAVFSKDRKYRYQLKRVWDGKLDQVVFIGLNPSRANEEEDDHTIRKLIGFCKRWGYGGFTIVNLFALVDTKQDELWNHTDPFGPENPTWVLDAIKESEMVVCCWGNGLKAHRMGMAVKRIREVLIKQTYCFGKNDNGTPKHPLRLPYTTELKHFI